MNRIRAWIRTFFGFSRIETNAFLILLPLMMILIFIEPVYEYWFTHQPQDFSKDVQALDSLVATMQWKEEKKKDSATLYKTYDKPARRFFAFDPNQSTKQELNQLGFTDAMAARIINYRSKGGKFKIKRDLLKMYNMDSGFYQSLYSYINLPENREEKKTDQPTAFFKKEPSRFDLNKADTSDLSNVYGIGSKLSARISKYREKIGGFISPIQLHEVFGLDSTVITELKKRSYIAEDFRPKMLNINSATEKELSSHPYIKYTLAKTITAYRFQHGPFQTVDDLKRIALIDEALFRKIKPYISLNP